MKILDCTLRDGGYYTNWDFDDGLVDIYLNTMAKLPISVVEIGYRSPPLTGYLGKYFYCPRFVLEHARSILGNDKKLSVMLNEKDIDPTILKNIIAPQADLIDIVRFAVDPKRIANLPDMISILTDLGIETGVNLMYASTYRDCIDDLVQAAIGVEKATYLSLVDSYGGSYPGDVYRIVTAVKQSCAFEVGFHGHNNLELAFANALAAIDAGCDWIDSTVTGMGRGAGNLKTELMLTWLAANGTFKIDMDRLSMLIDQFSPLWKTHEWGTNLPYMVSGASSLPQKNVMDWVTKRYFSFNTIIRALENQKSGCTDTLHLPPLNPAKAKEALLLGGGLSAKLQATSIIEWINTKTNLPLIHSSSRNSNSYSHLANPQYYCLIGNEAERLTQQVPATDYNKKTCVLPPFPRKMGTFIPDSLRKLAFELEKGTVSEENMESATAIAIATAVSMGVKILWVVGYDGYQSSEISPREHELFMENEAVFADAKAKDLEIRSLTATRYKTLVPDSIFSHIS